MGIVRGALKRVRGMMKDSDGKVLRNPDLRDEGRRLQEEGRAEAPHVHGHGKHRRPPER
ncbi:hypothetical protein ACIPPS_09420 [Streptomyces sp. NPDC090127]|uniref:hypothetical protein n=1 Tax=Streptomyces sp. NPDC090127 TaxID=3365953 RepID=UPI00380CEE58